LEEVINLKLRDFYRTVRVGSRAYFVQRCMNSHGWYMALAEYGGGWCGLIIVLEGRESRG
jgi:hypothetical protein